MPRPFKGAMLVCVCMCQYTLALTVRIVLKHMYFANRMKRVPFFHSSMQFRKDRRVNLVSSVPHSSGKNR